MQGLKEKLEFRAKSALANPDEISDELLDFALNESEQMCEKRSVAEFAIVNAVIGLVILQFLKIQGESFARNSEENKAIVEKYYNTKTKDKKIHSMNYFWVTSLIKDIGTKVLGVTVTSIGITIIAIQGMHDYTYLMLALANLFMFISLGLLGMNKAYNYFNNMHVPYMKEKIKEAEEQNGNNL